MMKTVSIFTTSLGSGGAERVVSTLYAHHLESINTKLYLSYSSVYYHVNLDNVIFLNNDSICPVSIIKKIQWHVRTLRRYRRYIHDEKPSVSVSFLDVPNIENMLACLFTRVKCIVSLRNNPKLIGGRAAKVSLWLARYFSDMMIVNSEEIRNLLITDYHYSADNICCIYNPMDVTQITSKKKESFDESFFLTKELVILAVGRLSPQKGYVHLLRVFAELRKKYSCRLAICGVGSLESELKILAENLHVQSSVSFLGWKSNVYKYMNAADIFVMSSLAEGQPNALIEALICGCPCVSVDCDYGPREILENGKYGLLSKKITEEVENPVADLLTDEERDLYDKLELMLTDKELRDEFRRKSVEIYDKFDEKIIVKKYFDTFLEGVQVDE